MRGRAPYGTRSTRIREAASTSNSPLRLSAMVPRHLKRCKLMASTDLPLACHEQPRLWQSPEPYLTYHIGVPAPATSHILHRSPSASHNGDLMGRELAEPPNTTADETRRSIIALCLNCECKRHTRRS